MKILAIDRGNSRTKVGLQDLYGGLDVSIFPNTDTQDLLQHIKKINFDAAVMSSVAATDLVAVADYLQAQRNFLFIDSETATPVKNEYATPNTLGTDRMAGAVGAWTYMGHQDVLLIDAGTCINYECVVSNVYKGGAIAPGLQMRLTAMHEHTGKLPLLSLPENSVELIGNSTATCMLSGAIMGTVNEITATAAHYQQIYPGIRLVLSGGDAAYLGKYLKNSIFAPHKEAVLLGLIEILKYNLNV